MHRMTMSKEPFKVAERYIQLKKHCVPKSWADSINLMNDMILMPVIVIFLFMLRQADVFFILSTVSRAYQTWSTFIEYTELRFEVQRMLLHTKMVGGPFIVTNDDTYMPYVLADAVVRTSTRH